MHSVRLQIVSRFDFLTFDFYKIGQITNTALTLYSQCKYEMESSKKFSAKICFEVLIKIDILESQSFKPSFN